MTFVAFTKAPASKSENQNALVENLSGSALLSTAL